MQAYVQAIPKSNDMLLFSNLKLSNLKNSQRHSKLILLSYIAKIVHNSFSGLFLHMICSDSVNSFFKI